jgi:Fe-S cluster assembly iron-binding protein IscA
MVQITDSAREKIKEMQAQQKGKYLRIYLDGVGWGGPRLGMALDEPADSEKPVKVNGVGVLIDGSTMALTDQTIIDYVDEPSGRGFLVKGASAC